MDELSRKLDWKVGTENDNSNQILIKKQWIHSLTEVVIEGSEVEILEKIKIARGKCQSCEQQTLFYFSFLHFYFYKG